ncbi:Wadjet anti-phage system protein JetD domain-containing protein [Chryseobacterium tongliaoense]
MDEHGFQVLHQLRSYHPHTQSVMMDRRLLKLFKIMQ